MPARLPRRVQPGGHRAAAARWSRSTASHKNPVTDGYICAKVRKFAERVYGADRLLYPAVRKGRKGEGQFQAGHVGRSARARSPTASGSAKAAAGGASILPYLLRRLERPADAGHHRRAAVPAPRHVAAGAHGVRGADRRGQHGALRQDAVGHLSGLSRGDADRPVGREPVRVGHSPRARTCARRRSAARSSSSSIRGRRRSRGRPIFISRSGPAPTSPSRWRSIAICSRTASPIEAFLASTRSGADRLRERAERVDVRAGGGRCRRRCGRARAASRSSTRESSPALIRCGWGLERNRNGGNAAMAILALPAVGGKFGVRGGGYSMSNSASWNIDAAVDRRDRAGHAHRQHEPPRARADRIRRSAGQVLFVYNCNPAATVPDQRRVIRGPRARGSLHRRLRAGDDRHGALRRRRAAGDDVPRRLRLREAYGPINLQLGRPVIDAVGESRSNADVFGELCARARACSSDGEPTGELDLMRRACSMRCPAPLATTSRGGTRPRRRSAPRRFSSSTCCRTRRIERSICSRRRSTRGADRPLSYPAGSGDRPLSAGADLAGERSHDQLDAGRAAARDVKLTMHLDDARHGDCRTATWCGCSTISARFTAR